MITRPPDGTRVKLTGPKKPFDRLQVRGIAWAGPAGLKVVEVTIDGGETWRPAGFMGESEPMSWRLWATEMQVKGPLRVTICARATDLAGNQQPQDAEINSGGYGNNAIHKVTVDVRA